MINKNEFKYKILENHPLDIYADSNLTCQKVKENKMSCGHKAYAVLAVENQDFVKVLLCKAHLFIELEEFKAAHIGDDVNAQEVNFDGDASNIESDKEKAVEKNIQDKKANTTINTIEDNESKEL